MPTLPTYSSTCTVYTDRAGFDALRPEWNGLLARSRFNSIFLTWEWQTTWWDTVGSGKLLLLAWRDPAGNLIGIAPLFRSYDDGVCSLQFVGCKEIADYLDLIVARDCEQEVYSAFLNFLQSKQAPPWDRIDLCNLYEPSLSYQLLPAMAQSAGLQVEVEQADVAPHLRLPPTFDAYLASLSKKQRHEIKRKRRKLEREADNWRWFEVRGGSDLERWVDEFIILHRMASSEKEAFMTAEMGQFFHRIAETAAEMGWLSLAFIEINGQLSSTMFDFVYDDRVWLYNSGYNPDTSGRLAPGVVLTSHLIEQAIVKGYEVFDFLQGDEVYKYRFGAVDARVMSVHLKR